MTTVEILELVGAAFTAGGIIAALRVGLKSVADKVKDVSEKVKEGFEKVDHRLETNGEHVAQISNILAQHGIRLDHLEAKGNGAPQRTH